MGSHIIPSLFSLTKKASSTASLNFLINPVQGHSKYNLSLTAPSDCALNPTHAFHNWQAGPKV